VAQPFSSTVNIVRCRRMICHGAAVPAAAILLCIEVLACPNFDHVMLVAPYFNTLIKGRTLKSLQPYRGYDDLGHHARIRSRNASPTVSQSSVTAYSRQTHLLRPFSPLNRNHHLFRGLSRPRIKLSWHYSNYEGIHCAAGLRC
jgi:hypothetical protein